MKTVNLRCEFLTDPLGIDARIPRLNWVVSGSGQQAAVQAGRAVFDLLPGHYRMRVSVEAARHE
jgi:hypothetical protein